MPQPGTGRADFLRLGDWNAYCSMCGRKRKASQMVRNWQGLYRCPAHNEPRQPQDFARGIKEDMSTPWAQPLGDNNFIEINTTFPLSISPSVIALVATGSNLATESGSILTTEGGVDIELETANYLAQAMVIVPGWVEALNYNWSWKSGGAGIAISSPNSSITNLTAGAPGLSGVLQCVVTSSLNAVGTATASVTT